MSKQKILSILGLAAVSMGSLGIFNAAAPTPADEIVVDASQAEKATSSNAQAPAEEAETKETSVFVEKKAAEAPAPKTTVNPTDETLHLYRFFAVGDEKDEEMYTNGYWGKQGVSYRPIWKGTDSSGKDVYIEPNYFRTEEGKVAYCLESGKPAPEFVNKDGKVSPETYQVLRAGYPFKTGADYDVSDIELEWATTLAVKIAEGTAYNADGTPNHDNKYELSDFGTNLKPVTMDPDGNVIPASEHEKIKGIVEKLVKASENTNPAFESFDMDASDAKVVSNEDGTQVISNISLSTSLSVEQLKKAVFTATDAEGNAVNVTGAFDLEGSVGGSPATLRGKLTIKTVDKVAKGTALTIKAEVPDAELVVGDTYIPLDEKEQKMYIVDTAPAQAEVEVFIPAEEVPEATGVIQIVKTGNNNGKTVNLKDVEFDVLDASGKVVAHIKTDENGVAKTGSLALGTYKVRETKTNDGYALLKDDMTVVLATEEGADNIVKEVKLTNEMTKVVLLKVEKGTDKGLKGCELAVYDESGKIVVNAVTDDNGNVTIMGLKPGNYQVGETKAPEGYKLNTSKISFTIDAYGDVSGTTTLEDEMTIVTLTKVDKADNSKKLSGATFEIKDANGKVVFTGSTDSYGKLTIGKMKPGTYKVRETKAPKGYQLSKEEITFTIKDDGKVEGTTQMSNEKTKVTITKQDKSDKKPLEGAVIGVKDSNGKEVFSGKTNSEGKVVIEGLEAGKYTFYEKEAPNGYVKTTETGSFTINENGEPVTGLIIMNEKIVTTKKTDNTDGKDPKKTSEKIKTGIDEEVGTSSMAVKLAVIAGVAVVGGIIVVGSKKRKNED